MSLLIQAWLEPRDVGGEAIRQETACQGGARVFRGRISDVMTRQTYYFDSPEALLDGLRDVLVQAGVMVISRRGG